MCPATSDQHGENANTPSILRDSLLTSILLLRAVRIQPTQRKEVLNMTRIEINKATGPDSYRAGAVFETELDVDCPNVS
jgi:hypothetical protein